MVMRMASLLAARMTHAAPMRESCQTPPVGNRLLAFSEIDWANWRARDTCSLVFIVDGPRVLLIRKKRGLGAGKVNGPGGKLHPGESPEACGIREVHEEVGLRVSALEQYGLLHFQFSDGYSTSVHVFRTGRYQGDAIETDEALPFWVEQAAAPYDEMWEDDRYWLPLLFAGVHFEGRFLFDDDRMLGYELERSDG